MWNWIYLNQQSAVQDSSWMIKILDLDVVYFFRWQTKDENLNNKIFFGSDTNVAPPVFGNYTCADNFLSDCKKLTNGFNDLIIDKSCFYLFKDELLEQLNLMGINVFFNPTMTHSGMYGESVTIAKVFGIDI